MRLHSRCDHVPVTNGQLKVVAWVWWLLCNGLLIVLSVPEGAANDLLLLASGLPLILAYGVPYAQRVYAAYRQGLNDKTENRTTAGR
jgi:hypothetical protein